MDTLSITGFALLIMETLVGMVANGFIVLIGCIDWFRSKKLSPTDLILTCLGLARLAWLAVVILDVTTFSFFLHTYVLNHVYLMITMVWFFIYNVNITFATWLSIFYFVKITTFSHPLFLHAKQRFPALVPWLLLGSVAFSAFMAMTILAVSSSSLITCDFSKLFLNNSYGSDAEVLHKCWRLFIAVTVPNVIPSVLFLSFTVLLIVSLWKHIRHLQHDGISTMDLNTNVHLRAIKALVSFAVLYLSSFVGISTEAILFFGNTDGSWTSAIFQTIIALYPSGHAVILIVINPRLKQAWVKMIHHLKCGVNEAPS
ncbi:taste receptor type 2 member 104-like [Heteronotia binoei]|uniref:taste receptor type 2 member 104-like n=1 Tax=Heteronotia binoei TaxID=13085 RepID=UPI00293073EF|nr:taste receptor type 2 member 104-like [Heteronotia binoei]